LVGQFGDVFVNEHFRGRGVRRDAHGNEIFTEEEADALLANAQQTEILSNPQPNRSQHEQDRIPGT
jgi:hypothetical protein